MAGWSTSDRPNAARCSHQWIASAVPRRITAVEPSTQSCRVPAIIVMIARTPCPGSPTIHATEPSSSISAVGFDLFPSLLLSRSMRTPFGVPSSSRRGTSRQVMPSRVCASTNRASDCTAETNHFWPVTRHKPSSSGSATVVPARTSEPPCFSVSAMAISAPRLSARGSGRGS